MTAALAWFAARKWLWPIAVVLAAVALYFGWRNVQRGIGARDAVREAQERHVEKIEQGNRARVDAGSGSERARRLRQRFRRAD